MTFQRILACILSLSIFISPSYPGPQDGTPMVITVPVAHLMSKQTHRHTTYDQSRIQATQLLYGEHVQGFEIVNGWQRVKAIEQPAQWKGRWITCSGWIPETYCAKLKHAKEHNLVVTSRAATLVPSGKKKQHQVHTLSFGTKLYGTKREKDSWTIALPEGGTGKIKATQVAELKQHHEEEKRLLVAERARMFLGDPYLWAGRSAYNPTTKTLTGTDCSGLVNILYRSIGMTLPRCSHDQYARSQKLTYLTPSNVGDLIFVYPESEPNSGKFSERITHVMVYLGNDRFLEAKGENTSSVRVVLGSQYFGKPLETIASGEELPVYKTLGESPMGHRKVTRETPHGRYKLVFGSYLGSSEA